jgi:hypothetical protein
LVLLPRLPQCLAALDAQKDNLIDRLDSRLRIFETMVSNVATLARSARMHVQQTEQEAGAATGAAPPGEGVWSHSDLVATYLSVLQRLYDNSSVYMASGHASTLWTELVQGAPVRQDMVRGVAFFKAAVGAREPWLENTDAAAILRRVPLLQPGNVTKEVFALTWSMFLQVGLHGVGAGAAVRWGDRKLGCGGYDRVDAVQQPAAAFVGAFFTETLACLYSTAVQCSPRFYLPHTRRSTASACCPCRTPPAVAAVQFTWPKRSSWKVQRRYFQPCILPCTAFCGVSLWASACIPSNTLLLSCRHPIPSDLPHLWCLFETCTSNAVANQLRQRLVDLYHCQVAWQERGTPRFRTAFIE